MLKEVFYKKNEMLEVEFYQDKECTEAFNFDRYSEHDEDLYIILRDGDVSPLLLLRWEPRAKIYVPYIAVKKNYNIFGSGSGIKFNASFIFLDDITPNLSKYIPEDNAVLFLSGKVQEEYFNSFMPNELYTYKDKHIEGKSILENIFYYGTNINELQEAITIFLPHGTKDELKKANQVAKELKEKYGVEEVNLFVLHWFIEPTKTISTYYIHNLTIPCEETEHDFTIYTEGEIIATNSTGILEPQNTERLQVIDCKELFEEWVSTQNS